MVLTSLLAASALAGGPVHPVTGEPHVPMYTDKMVLVSSISPAWPEPPPADAPDQVACTFQLYVDPAGLTTATEVLDCPVAFVPEFRRALVSWVWEPVLVRGAPISVTFPVTLEMEHHPRTGAETVVDLDEEEPGVVVHPGNERAYPLRTLDQLTLRRPATLPDGTPGCEALLFVLPSGRVEDVGVSRACPHGDRAATAAARWRFEPVVEDGERQRFAVRVLLPAS